MTGTRAFGRGEGGRQVLELPRCKLVVLSGDQRGEEALMAGEVYRIGKSAKNDLVLDDETVSRAHCEILREARGFLLRDLGSTNGTLLDGAEIREAYLKPGAVITVGEVELKVRPHAERIEVLPSESERFGLAFGRSLVMREIFGLLERLAPTDATMLLGGETGTGKDVLARSIHAASPRADKPFIVVDCGAVVGTLIASELFGHERGAFTGANARREGAFELADGGTLFLDEVGELPLDLQPKLLRVLEERRFRRVGGSREIRVDVRIIAASKRNLEMEVARGKFREDLFFRLAVVPVTVPPLRERLDDVPLLAETLLAAFVQKQMGRPSLKLSEEASAGLRAHDWPGNVRELRNVLERAGYMTLAMGQTEVGVAHLPAGLAGVSMGSTSLPTFDPALSYRETKTRFEEDFESRYVRWLLERHEGNVSAAARAADMDRKYLSKLAKKHGLR
ncbi:MAG: FHA domain-containing protein [Deltaproteobacteria bacterium]|nr:FHA domain-containing protein [Deltaproteobacteria bacterium]